MKKILLVIIMVCFCVVTTTAQTTSIPNHEVITYQLPNNLNGVDFSVLDVRDIAMDIETNTMYMAVGVPGKFLKWEIGGEFEEIVLQIQEGWDFIHNTNEIIYLDLEIGGVMREVIFTVAAYGPPESSANRMEKYFTAIDVNTGEIFPLLNTNKNGSAFYNFSLIGDILYFLDGNSSTFVSNWIQVKHLGYFDLNTMSFGYREGLLPIIYPATWSVGGFAADINASIEYDELNDDLYMLGCSKLFLLDPLTGEAGEEILDLNPTEFRNSITNNFTVNTQENYIYYNKGRETLRTERDASAATETIVNDNTAYVSYSDLLFHQRSDGLIGQSLFIARKGKIIEFREDELPLEGNIAILSDYNGYAVSMFGRNDGEVLASATGGGGEPYTYEWQHNLSPDPNQTWMFAGDYTCIVTDSKGNSIELNVTLNQPERLSAGVYMNTWFNSYHVSCFGATDGEVKVFARGGVQPYIFEWEHIDSQDPHQIAMAGGDYKCWITDANGCRIYVPVTLREPDPLEAEIIGPEFVYYGYQDINLAELEITNITGGVEDYVVMWDNGETTASIVVQPTTSTSYFATVIDANGCEKRIEFILNVVDIRCGKNLNKIIVCHKTGGKKAKTKTLCISPNAVPAHLAKGGSLGPCPDNGSIGILEEELELLAYPNPFYSELNIQLNNSESQDITVEILDGYGRVVFSKEMDNCLPYFRTIIQTGNISEGAYYLRVRTDDDVKTKVLFVR